MVAAMLAARPPTALPSAVFDLSGSVGTVLYPLHYTSVAANEVDMSPFRGGVPHKLTVFADIPDSVPARCHSRTTDANHARHDRVTSWPLRGWPQAGIGDYSQT